MSSYEVSKYMIYTHFFFLYESEILSSKYPALPQPVCMCSHVYLWCIWTTWRCKTNTGLSDIWATARPPGSRAAVWFGPAQQEPSPSLSALMRRTHSSVWRQQDYSVMKTLSVVPFCCWKHSAFHMPGGFYPIVLWCLSIEVDVTPLGNCLFASGWNRFLTHFNANCCCPLTLNTHYRNTIGTDNSPFSILTQLVWIMVIMEHILALAFMYLFS